MLCVLLDNNVLLIPSASFLSVKDVDAVDSRSTLLFGFLGRLVAENRVSELISSGPLVIRRAFGCGSSMLLHPVPRKRSSCEIEVQILGGCIVGLPGCLGVVRYIERWLVCCTIVGVWYTFAACFSQGDASGR